MNKETLIYLMIMYYLGSLEEDIDIFVMETTGLDIEALEYCIDHEYNFRKAMAMIKADGAIFNDLFDQLKKL